MVQGCWPRLSHTEDCDWGKLYRWGGHLDMFIPKICHQSLCGAAWRIQPKMGERRYLLPKQTHFFTV